jgi:hypothetical protein
LRYDGFEPKARGVRALLPHVDRSLPIHSVASLEQVARALSATQPSAAPRGSRIAPDGTAEAVTPAA